jgi:hypothetical protein
MVKEAMAISTDSRDRLTVDGEGGDGVLNGLKESAHR